MAPVLRPNDPAFSGAPGASAPPGGGARPPMGGGPGGLPAPPGGPPGAPGGPPMPDPAQMERESMLALLEQAVPVPGTVQRHPDAYDTMPKPYFPPSGESRTRRSGQGY